MKTFIKRMTLCSAFIINSLSFDFMYAYISLIKTKVNFSLKNCSFQTQPLQFKLRLNSRFRSILLILCLRVSNHDFSQN